MFRAVVSALAVAAAVAAPAAAAAKRVAAPPPPVVRAVRADATLVGKVTAIEKETVAAAEAPGAPKAEYRVAVVKVEAALLGGDPAATHVKVGFVPPPVDAAGNPLPRRGYPAITLAPGQEGLFFLVKHPSAGFYVVQPILPPVDGKAENFAAAVAAVKKAAGVLAGPAAALKAGKPEDRYFAAAVLLAKYRTVPDGREVDQVKVAADESRLILQAVAGADWTRIDPAVPSPATTFYQLALGQQDGFTPPKPQPNGDYQAQLKAAFAGWVDGPGKAYQVTKLVPKN